MAELPCGPILFEQRSRKEIKIKIKKNKPRHTKESSCCSNMDANTSAPPSPKMFDAY
jgi:hypothetical protein